VVGCLPGAARVEPPRTSRPLFRGNPIDIDDLEGYAFLQANSPMRIAAGEWQNTHFEFLDLADRLFESFVISERGAPKVTVTRSDEWELKDSERPKQKLAT
jgi:hypothetical protein